MTEEKFCVCVYKQGSHRNMWKYYVTRRLPSKGYRGFALDQVLTDNGWSSDSFNIKYFRSEEAAREAGEKATGE